MSDTWANPFKSFFFAGDDKNTPQALRQKIALAMLMQKQARPKTFGEGLSAIGDAIGDRSVAGRIEREAAEAERAAAAARGEILGTSPPATAVDAVNRAAQPMPSMPPPSSPRMPIVPAGPPGAARPPITAPSGGAAPVAAGPGGLVEPGDFNEIDAADPRNRYKPPPPYLAAALERNVADPERRGYLGQLAGKEAQSAGEVSSTGAAGPFQFTRGTGAQYGIPGNARFDPDAATVAANRFTDDNARALAARLGREPTPGELALAHQQGAGTAGSMLQGTGNAPPRNLAVNNVPPGMGPQAAAAKVMSYYGMPGAGGAPPSPRDGVATALMQQPEPGRPTVADYGQKLALAPTPPAQEIAQAPPAPPIQRAPPPQQVAQAGPQPGYVLELGPEPERPPTATPTMQRIQNMIANAPPAHADSIKAKLAPIYEQEEAKLAQANATYKDAMTERRALKLEQEKQKADAAGRVTGVRKDVASATETEQKNALRAQFGNMPPDEVFKNVSESHKVASSAAKGLQASQAAMAAFNSPGGVITGTGANQRLDVAKLFTYMGLADKGDVIANTETFRNAMAPVVASIMHQTSGTSQLSEGELRFAQRAAAGDITLDAASIKQLTAIIDKGAKGIIDDHSRKVDVLFGDNAQAKSVYGVTAPKPPAPPKSKDDEAREWATQHPNDPRAAAIRQRLGM